MERSKMSRFGPASRSMKTVASRPQPDDELTACQGAAVTARQAAGGLAYGDFDNDAELHLVITNDNETPSLLRHDTSPRGGCLSIRLIGVQSNRDGIGARVTVTA